MRSNTQQNDGSHHVRFACKQTKTKIFPPKWPNDNIFLHFQSDALETYSTLFFAYFLNVQRVLLESLSFGNYIKAALFLYPSLRQRVCVCVFRNFFTSVVISFTLYHWPSAVSLRLDKMDRIKENV